MFNILIDPRFRGCYSMLNSRIVSFCSEKTGRACVMLVSSVFLNSRMVFMGEPINGKMFQFSI